MDSHSRRRLSRWWWFFSDFIFLMCELDARCRLAKPKRNDHLWVDRVVALWSRQDIPYRAHIMWVDTQNTRARGDEKRKKSDMKSSSSKKKGNKRQNRISSSSNFLWNTTEREDRTNCVCVRIFSCYVALLLSFHIISNHPYVALIIALPPRSFKKSSSSFDCVCLLWNCGKSWKLWFSYPYFGFGLISTPALP